MEGGKGPEFTTQTAVEKTDAGFSEKRAARILEGKQADNAQVAKRKSVILTPKQKIVKRDSRLNAPVVSSQREKILFAHEKNAQEMIGLIRKLGLIAKGSIRQEEQLMVEIRARHKIQDQLLNALILDNRGQLTEDALPKELQDLIK